MMKSEAEIYALEVRERVFDATIDAIAKLKHPKGTSAQARTLSFYATVDALLKVVGELVAEAGLSSSSAIEMKILEDLNAALVRHFTDAKDSIARRGTRSVN